MSSNTLYSSAYPAYPAAKTVNCDIIAADGSICTGCRIGNGKIVPALGGVRNTACAFTDVKAAGYSAAAGAYFVCADRRVFYSADGLSFSELAALEGEEPFIFGQREGAEAKLYAVGDGKCVYFGGGAGGEKAFDCGIYGGVIKNGRLFGIDKDDKFRLCWSGSGGAFDQTEGINGAGWVRLDGAGGEILNLIIYGERLIAVRENGLSVLSAYGTPENFKAEGKGLNISGICKNTAAVAGNKLIFCAEGGLYCYNGAKITRADCGLIEKTENPVCAAANGGLYLLGVYAKPLERNAVLVYDTASGLAYFADAPASAIVASGGGIFAYSAGNACRLARGGTFCFEAAIDFGSAKQKYLKTLEIAGAEEADIEIFNGRTTRVFKDAKSALLADMRGVNFTFKVKGNAEITALRATAEVLDGI